TRADCGNGGTKTADVDIACEQLQRGVQSRARLQQESKIECKGRHVLRASSLPKTEIETQKACLAFRNNGLNRNKVKVVDTMGHLVCRLLLDQYADHFSGLSQCTIAKVGHNRTVRS